MLAALTETCGTCTSLAGHAAQFSQPNCVLLLTMHAAGGQAAATPAAAAAAAGETAGDAAGSDAAASGAPGSSKLKAFSSFPGMPAAAAGSKGFSSFPGMPSGGFETSVLQKLQQKSQSKQQ